MASGVHAGHGPVGQAAAGGGMAELTGDPTFQRLLSQSAEALGASEGAVMQAMHEAESLVAGRTDLTEDQKLAAMMDYVTERFNASDLDNDEMMALMELCRMCLDAWTQEAAAEEGYQIAPASALDAPFAGIVSMIGRDLIDMVRGEPEPPPLRVRPTPPIITDEE